jgi:hypothetical protein
MIKRTLILTSLLLGGCAQEAPPAAIPFELVNDTRHLMELVLDPATDVIWGSAGFVLTEAGEQDLQPTTDEGWHAVESAAAVVAETGNLLMLPGRSQGDDWLTYSIGLREAGKLAMKAALEKDAEALFDAGGNIYQVCKSCHNQYWVEEESAAE